MLKDAVDRWTVTDASELYEVVPIRAGQIHRLCVPLLDDLPRIGQLIWKTHLRREDIHRADGEHSESDVRAREPVHHFVHRAVPACGHDHAEALLHRIHS